MTLMAALLLTAGLPGSQIAAKETHEEPREFTATSLGFNERVLSSNRYNQGQGRNTIRRMNCSCPPAGSASGRWKINSGSHAQAIKAFVGSGMMI
jgi:hypothetical protein